WAHVVECPGQRNNAPRADQAICRLVTYDSTVRRRISDRTRCVRPQRAIAETSGNRRSRPTGRAAGNTAQVPGIMNTAEVRHERASAKRELMHVGFADKHGARSLQFADH